MAGAWLCGLGLHAWKKEYRRHSNYRWWQCHRCGLQTEMKKGRWW